MNIKVIAPLVKMTFSNPSRQDLFNYDKPIAQPKLLSNLCESIKRGQVSININFPAGWFSCNIYISQAATSLFLPCLTSAADLPL